MRFGIWTVLYVLALLAASLTTFGTSSWIAAIVVLTFWGLILDSEISTKVPICLLILVLLVTLLMPALPSVREVARRNQCFNNLKQISLALQNYQDDYGCFPPAYVADENGKPMHSWRVLILPYIERRDLYEAYDFNEPWNGPKNSKLANVCPIIFKCPSAKDPETDTNYLAIVGSQTAWPDGNSSRLEDFDDGTSKTIIIMESHDRNINWMEPRDLSFDEAVASLSATELPRTKGGHQPADTFFYRRFGGFGHLACYANGNAGFFPFGFPAAAAAARLTIAGGELIEDVEYRDHSPMIHYELKWDRVCLLSVFVALALLPAPWAWRARRRVVTRDTGDA